MGGRIGRVKVKELVGLDGDILIGKAKAARASKAKQGIHPPVPMGRQAFRYPQESKATSRVTREDPRNALPSPTSFFPQCEIEYSCCQLGSAVLACLLPASCAPPVFSLVGWDEEQQEVLTLCKHCSAVMETTVCCCAGRNQT